MNDGGQAATPKSSPLENRLKRIDEAIFQLDAIVDCLAQKTEVIRCSVSLPSANQKDLEPNGCQLEQALHGFERRIRLTHERINQLIDEFQI